MARHPEVKEKDIIDAALALEKTGKIPNPGAIRAALGQKGGLVRIRDVWNKYNAKRNSNFGEIDSRHLSLDDLPSEISDSAVQLIAGQREQLEHLIVTAFQRCQTLYEKRVDDLTIKFETNLDYYREYESTADESITLLETDMTSLQTELKDLAEQNANLLIENSKLAGKVAAYETAFPNSQK